MIFKQYERTFNPVFYFKADPYKGIYVFFKNIFDFFLHHGKKGLNSFFCTIFFYKNFCKNNFIKYYKEMLRMILLNITRE